MTTGYHRFRLGEFECTALRDGSFNYPLDSFFTNAPRGHLEEVLRRKGLPTEHVSTPYTCLFVDTGAHRVMIDTATEEQKVAFVARDPYFLGFDINNYGSSHPKSALLPIPFVEVNNNPDVEQNPGY